MVKLECGEKKKKKQPVGAAATNWCRGWLGRKNNKPKPKKIPCPPPRCAQ